MKRKYATTLQLIKHKNGLKRRIYSNSKRNIEVIFCNQKKMRFAFKDRFNEEK
jgi:hypothetical protein